jgi:hypothetical protein
VHKITTLITLIFLEILMTDLEKIIWCITNIDSMLLLDFMTDPVREDLNKLKLYLEQVRDSMTN